MALPSSSLRPSWILRGIWPLSPPSGVVGAAPELSARRGWPGDRQGTPWGCPPWHASTSWGCRQPWAARGPRSRAGAGCFLGSFEPFLSYLVCIFWIPWICILRTWPLTWVSKAGGLSEVCHSQPSLFSSWPQTSQSQLLFCTTCFLLEEQETCMQLLGRDLLPELLLSVFLTTKCDKVSRDPDLDPFSSSAFLYEKTIYFCPYLLITSSEVCELFLVSDEASGFCIVKQYETSPTDWHCSKGWSDSGRKDKVARAVENPSILVFVICASPKIMCLAWMRHLGPLSCKSFWDEDSHL